jgi:hypothetical protein
MTLYLRDARISASVAEFCSLSGLKTSSVWKLLREGKLQSICVGRRRLVLLASYHEFIERQRAGPPLDARRNKTRPPLGSKANPGSNGSVTPLNPPVPLAAPLDLRIEELGLSTRAINVMRNEGIDRVSDLIDRTARDLLLAPNFGRVCLGEVERALALLHLQLRGRETAAAE